jgi:hypothetical protein
MAESTLMFLPTGEGTGAQRSRAILQRQPSEKVAELRAETRKSESGTRVPGSLPQTAATRCVNTGV